MVKVKICGLTRIEDVEKAVELGADALGFIFEPNTPRYLCDRDDWESVVGSAPLFTPTIAVYGTYRVRKDPCSLVQSVRFREIPEVRKDHFFSPAVVIPDPRPALFTFRFQAGEDTEAAKLEINASLELSYANCCAIHLDGYSPDAFGGTGLRANWRVAAALVREMPQFPFVLAGGLTPDNVADAIESVHPYAVDVSSGIESAPGLKDYHKMRDFIQAAKQR